MLNTSIRRAVMWQTGDFCGLESAMQGRPIRLSFCLCCECFFRVVAAVPVAVANVLLTSFLRQTQTCFHFFQRILRMQLCRRRRPCSQVTTGNWQRATCNLQQRGIHMVLPGVRWQWNSLPNWSLHSEENSDLNYLSHWSVCAQFAAGLWIIANFVAFFLVFRMWNW